MKIKFPDPTEFKTDIDGFFDQLELSVYHARKSWEKIKISYSKEQLEDDSTSPWCTFRHPFLDNNYDKYAVDILDPGKDQDIEIEIGFI